VLIPVPCHAARGRNVSPTADRQSSRDRRKEWAECGNQTGVLLVLPFTAFGHGAGLGREWRTDFS